MNAPDALFTSPRERRLWFWTLAVVVAIYSTLGLAGMLVEVMREHELMTAVFFCLMLLTMATIVASGLSSGLRSGLASGAQRRPGAREIWIAFGVVSVYGMTVLRMGVSPEERTHLFEYGIVALLIHQALAERARNGRRVPVPAVLAVVATALLGWLDEGIQSLVPNRVYDNFDVFSNALAAVLAIVPSVIIAWVTAALARRRGSGSDA